MWEASWNIVLIVATTVNPAVPVDDLSLEPCINGGVSARGTHANQVAEDIFHYLEVPQFYDSMDLSWSPALIAKLPRRSPSAVGLPTRHWLA